MRIIYVSSSTSGSEFSVGTPRTIKNDDRGALYCSNEVRTFRYLFTVRAGARFFYRSKSIRRRRNDENYLRKLQYQRFRVLGEYTSNDKGNDRYLSLLFERERELLRKFWQVLMSSVGSSRRSAPRTIRATTVASPYCSNAVRTPPKKARQAFRDILYCLYLDLCLSLESALFFARRTRVIHR